MAYMNYGFGKAFAYRAPWQWMTERKDRNLYRQQMIDERRLQRKQQRSAFMAQSMKFGQTTNPWDTQQYNKYLDQELPRLYAFANENPDFMYNPEQMIRYKRMAHELQNHPAIERSLYVQNQRDAFANDVNSGKVKPDDPNAMQFNTDYERYITSGGEVPMYNREEEFDWIEALHDNFSRLEISENPKDWQTTVTQSGVSGYIRMPSREAIKSMTMATLAENPEAYQEAYDSMTIKEGSLIEWVERMGWYHANKQYSIDPKQGGNGDGTGKAPPMDYFKYNVEEAHLWGSQAVPDDDVKYLIPHYGLENKAGMFYPSGNDVWISHGEDNWVQTPLPKQYDFQITKGSHIIPGSDTDNKASNKFAAVEMGVTGTKVFVMEALLDVYTNVFGGTLPTYELDKEVDQEKFMKQINSDPELQKFMKFSINSMGMKNYEIRFTAAAPVDRQYAQNYNEAKGALSSSKAFAHRTEEYYEEVGRVEGDIPYEAVKKDSNLVLNSAAIAIDDALTKFDFIANLKDYNEKIGTSPFLLKYQADQEAWLAKEENQDRSPEEFLYEQIALKVKNKDGNSVNPRYFLNALWLDMRSKIDGLTFEDFIGKVINDHLIK